MRHDSFEHIWEALHKNRMRGNFYLVYKLGIIISDADVDLLPIPLLV